MGAVSLGPLSLSVEMLATFAAIVLATAAGNRTARATGVRVESTLWIVIACALLMARAAYVLRYRDAYMSNPSSVFNVRDGGSIAWAGIVAGLVLLAWFSWRMPAKRMALIASGVVGVAVWAGVALAVGAKPGQALQVPHLALPNLAGGTTGLDGFGDKPLVVNLWASWCPPCRREMPLLSQAQKRHPGIAFVFVNQGESAAAVRGYLGAQDITLQNVLLDHRFELPAMIGSQGLPATLFFDAKGRLVDTRVGELSAASLAQRLDRVLDVR
ncbi:MAG: TlpA disulfide reductase family protein [Telluria sp.]